MGFQRFEGVAPTQLSSSDFRGPGFRSPQGTRSAPLIGEQGSMGDGRSPIPAKNRVVGRTSINPLAQATGGGGSGGMGGSVAGGAANGGWDIPDFSKLAAGGGFSGDGKGGFTAQNANYDNMFASLMEFLGRNVDAQAGQNIAGINSGNQLLGVRDTNAANIEQTRLGTGAQVDVAGINAGAQTDIAGINAGAQTGVAEIQKEQAILEQELRNALGFDTNDTNLGISQQQTDAERYGYDRQFDQTQYVTDAETARAATALEFLQANLPGSGTSPDFGMHVAGLPQFNTQAAQNEAYARNAQQEAAALNSPEYGGGSPMSGAAARDAALNRAMADTQAQYGIERQDQQSQFDNMIAALQQKANMMNAQTNARAPMYSFLQSLV